MTTISIPLTNEQVESLRRAIRYAQQGYEFDMQSRETTDREMLNDYKVIGHIYNRLFIAQHEAQDDIKGRLGLGHTK